MAVGLGVDFVILDHLSIVVSGLDGGDERRTIGPSDDPTSFFGRTNGYWNGACIAPKEARWQSA